MKLSPYPPSEFFSMVWRRFTPRPPSTLAPVDIEIRDAVPDRWIGFVGDVCPLFGRAAEFADDVRAFFAPCDTLVGNYEGVLTSRAWFPYKMKHSSATFDALASIAPLDTWVLSVANNHGGDYGPEALRNTIEAFEARGIRWAGTPGTPRVSLGGNITLTTWTWWTNSDAAAVARHDPGVPSEAGLHVAYPHWGYEHERTPRPSQTPPRGYPLVVGHHSHLPQPLDVLDARTGVRVEGQTPSGMPDDVQVVAWSLGNFITGKQLDVLGEGALLRVGLADGADGTPEVVQVAFRPTRLHRDAATCRVEMMG